MEAEKLFLLFSILMLQFSSCTSQDSLKINQTIKEGDLLISKGNSFALGFFSPGSSSNRYLGIWYHKVPEQTVVWVANRNDPIIGSSGFLFINQHGSLVLYGNDDQKLPVWSTDVSVEENDYCAAQLLDSGNLILVRKRSRKIVWQSFDYPTNTLLPGMKLGLDRKLGIDRFLTSWRSAEDPGFGDFSVRINPTGSPQFFLYNGNYKPISRAAPWPWRSQMSLYTMTFVNDPDEIYSLYTVPDDSYLLRIIVDHPGHVKALTWRDSDCQWKEYWQSPQFHCDYYGHCGAYSTCELANRNEFGCACLPGFEPKHPLEWSTRDGSGGCVRKRLHTSSVCQHGEGFLKVENVVLPESSVAVWMDMSKSLADCEVQCKSNCSCSAYAIIAIAGKKYGCLTWYKELVDIRYDRSYGYDLYVRVDAYELADTTRKSNDSREKPMLAVLAPSIALVWFLVSLFAYLWFKKRAKKGTELQVNSTSTELKYFKLSTITAATNNFSPANKLGQGGFGSVYKGLLANGLEVAIKRLSRSSAQGTEEFKNEVMVIAMLQHRNLVKLLGYCNQDAEQMLIYEYLPNKSLDSFLFRYLEKRRRSELLSLDPETCMSSSKDLPSAHECEENLNITFYDLGTIRAATDNFSSERKLGEGGFGPVYKGKLSNGKEVAIKRLSKNSGQAIDEFKNEVLLIAKLQHRNLVRLLGCCIEAEEKKLIYEYMPNKSLDCFIFDQSRKASLGWEKRFEIIMGIARGILYLHQDSRLRIIHRDLKTSNVLLDGEMNAKISDFGTARIFCGNQNQANTNRVVGTFGYMSPEYALDGLFAVKSDVFSFGVLLLEIISGRKNIGFFKEDLSSNLIRYTWNLWKDGKALEMMDLSIRQSCPNSEVLRCIHVGLLCVQDCAANRPTMSEIIFMLSTDTTLPSPTQPTFSITRSQNDPSSPAIDTRSSVNQVTISLVDAR